MARWLEGHTTLTLKTANLAVKAVNLAVKAVNFGSQTNEFGSQGGTQDVVEEWLKEDEYRDGVEKKIKCGTHQGWRGKEDKVGQMATPL